MSTNKSMDRVCVGGRDGRREREREGDREEKREPGEHLDRQLM